MTDDFDSQPIEKDQKIDSNDQSGQESLVTNPNESVEKVIPSDFNRKMKIRSVNTEIQFCHGTFFLDILIYSFK